MRMRIASVANTGYTTGEHICRCGGAWSETLMKNQRELILTSTQLPCCSEFSMLGVIYTHKQQGVCACVCARAPVYAQAAK